MSNIIPPHIQNLSPYIPGRLIEEVEAELGFSGIIKLASNENSLGVSPKVMAAVLEAATRLHRYGDADSRSLKQALVSSFDFDLNTLVIGNGSSEFILLLCHALLTPDFGAIMSKPSFTLYATNSQAAGAVVTQVPLTPDFKHDLPSITRAIDERTRLIFLDNPLNPTGAWLNQEELLDFYLKLPEQVILVVDEAYVEFSSKPKVDWRPYLSSPGRLVVMRTFSKAYGLAGLRVAYALMEPSLAEALNKIRQPFNVNALAQAGAIAALDDHVFFKQTLDMTRASLEFFKKELSTMGLGVHPTEANFLMVDLGERSADEVFKAVLAQGVITRSLSSFGLPHHLRISAGLPEESKVLVEALRRVL